MAKMTYKNILTTYLELIDSGLPKEEANKKAWEIHSKPDPSSTRVKETEEPIDVKNISIDKIDNDSFWNRIVFCTLLFCSLFSITIPTKQGKNIDTLTLYEEFISMGMSDEQAKIQARNKSDNNRLIKKCENRYR